jgi:hypothetical protein
MAPHRLEARDVLALARATVIDFAAGDSVSQICSKHPLLTLELDYR